MLFHTVLFDHAHSRAHENNSIVRGSQVTRAQSSRASSWSRGTPILLDWTRLGFGLSCACHFQKNPLLSFVYAHPRPEARVGHQRALCDAAAPFGVPGCAIELNVDKNNKVLLFNALSFFFQLAAALGGSELISLALFSPTLVACLAYGCFLDFAQRFELLEFSVTKGQKCLVTCQ